LGGSTDFSRKDVLARSKRQKILLSVLPLPAGFQATHGTESYQILGRVFALSASRLNIMDLKILYSRARLTISFISL
jgi:hypothetical protein